MAMVSISGPMEVPSVENSKTDKKTAKAPGSPETKRNNTKAATKMGREKATECTFGQMASFTKDSLSRI